VRAVTQMRYIRPRMHDRDLIRELERLFERQERRLFELLVEVFGHPHHHESPPAACTLTGKFIISGDSDMSTTQLTAVLPTTRLSGAVLAAAAIASITFQKVAAGATAETVLQTNNAASAGAGLQPSDLLFTDSTAAAGDTYTCFVTDTAGVVGELSNDFVNGGSPTTDPPGAPTLTGVFTQ
jgi:hypothetical protein